MCCNYAAAGIRTVLCFSILYRVLQCDAVSFHLPNFCQHAYSSVLVCHNALQCVAVCCSVLQHVSISSEITVNDRVLLQQFVARWCNVLQCVFQCVAAS